jgi:hypothetical protein
VFPFRDSGLASTRRDLHARSAHLGQHPVRLRAPRPVHGDRLVLGNTSGGRWGPAELFVAAAWGWRAAFAIIAGGSACARTGDPGARRTGTARTSPGVRALVAHKLTRRITLVTLLANLGGFTLYSTLGLALSSLAHVSPRLLPVYYLLFGAAEVAGNVAGAVIREICASSRGRSSYPLWPGSPA